MICPTCRRYSAVGKFCSEDGTRLLDHKCVCGAELTGHQKFCHICGTQVKEKANAPATS